MNKQFWVDSSGIVKDFQSISVATITASDTQIRESLVLRLNLFDDMLRVIELLNRHRSLETPEIALEDVATTLGLAKLA